MGTHSLTAAHSLILTHLHADQIHIVTETLPVERASPWSKKLTRHTERSGSARQQHGLSSDSSSSSINNISSAGKGKGGLIRPAFPLGAEDKVEVLKEA